MVKASQTKYDRIGAGYNNTRCADPFITGRLHSLLCPEQNKQYIEVGCGTGNYTIALAMKGLRIGGIDPSEKMLEQAHLKNAGINWQIGTAEDTGFNTSSLDGIVCVLTLHHWENLQSAFSEFNRILKSNGRLVIFTSTPEQMSSYWLNHYFPKMLDASMKQMPTKLLETHPVTILSP